MTTLAAENLYLAQHLVLMEGKNAVCYNPNGLEIDKLPHIICFLNGGSSGWYDCIAVSEDGECLGGHICSHEGYLPNDLGVLQGCREDRHRESYSKHYPNGYKMIHIPSGELLTHPLFIKLMEIQKEKESKTND